MELKVDIFPSLSEEIHKLICEGVAEVSAKFDETVEAEFRKTLTEMGIPEPYTRESLDPYQFVVAHSPSGVQLYHDGKPVSAFVPYPWLPKFD